MWWISLLFIGVAIWLLAESGFGNRAAEQPWPLFARPLLTEREQIFYQRLLSAYSDHLVFAQVAISQLIDVAPGTADRRAHRNRFDRLVADFVLCQRDFSVVAVNELDDRSHLRQDRQDADRRKARALQAAGLQLIRVPAGPLPTNRDLKALIESATQPPEPIVLPPRNAQRARGAFEDSLLRSGLRLAAMAAVLLAGWIVFSTTLPSVTPRTTFEKPALPTPPAPSTSPAPTQPSAAAAASRPRMPPAADGAIASQPSAAALAARKEQAWKASYSAPAACEHPPTWNDQVECGNRYMRAKKGFEARWHARNAGDSQSNRNLEP